MKLRPQFQLRFRDASQFVTVADRAKASGMSMNEWLLRRIESAGSNVETSKPVAEKRVHRQPAQLPKVTESVDAAQEAPVGDAGCPKHGVGCGFFKAGGWFCGKDMKLL